MAALPPVISIVVPLPGEPDVALACVQAIARQPDDPPFEVIVVAGDPRLRELLARLQGDVKTISSPRPLPLADALRRGAEQAQGEVVVLLAPGGAPGPSWLTGLHRALDDPAIGLAASAGPMTDAASVAIRHAAIAHLADCDGPDDRVLCALALSIAQSGAGITTAHDSVVTPAPPRPTSHVHPPRSGPELSIVIPTLDATTPRVRECLEAIAATTTVPHEVVLLDNGSSPQGFTDPVNSGLRAARGDYAVIMNDDVVALPGWWEPLRAALDAGASVAFPETIDGPMRTDFAAWCFAIGRSGLREFAHREDAFFDPALVVWFQDTDLYTRLCAAGRAPVLVPGSRIRHAMSQTLASEDPALRAWIDRQTAADHRSFLDKHPDARLTPVALGA